MTYLRDRKVVILGASAGIGRALAVHVAAAGAETLLCGRREARLQDLLGEIGSGALCAVDLSVVEDVDRLAARVAGMAPVDAVVSTVGLAQLKQLSRMSQADWLEVLGTNVVGVNAAIQALLPSIRSGGLVWALSSEVVTMPRWALGAYSASKAALEVSLAGWRLEYPDVRFGAVAVGATFPTEFGRGFGDDILGTALDLWAAQGLIQEEMMDPDEVGRVLAGMLANLLPFPGIGMEHVVLRTPSPVTGSSEAVRRAALG